MVIDPTTREQLAKLREPFPEHQILALPKMEKQADGSKKKIWINYVGHAALTARLLDVDPTWSWVPMGRTPEGAPVFDASGGLWILLTVCGVTRPGYGHANKTGGDGTKEVIGDALRNAAMRFGCALELWHKGGGLYPDDKSAPADDEGDAPTEAAPPLQERARELLKMFETARSLSEVDEISETLRAEWKGESGLCNVPGLADAVVASKTNAVKRLGG